MALNLAGYATFASPNPAIIQAHRAIRHAMGGNDHFGVATPLHHDRNEIHEGTAPGLAWVQRIFNLEPQSTVEPDPQVIEQTIQSLLPSSTIQVTFLTEGSLNKLYDVKIANEVFFMGVSLPVDPYYKTMSEVSTVDWISRTANIPVPRVITYQSSRQNPIGFEWIIMTKIPGRPLKELWRSLSFSAKISLVGKFAAYSSCLFRDQFQGIGNLYGTASLPNDSRLSEAAWPSGNLAYSNNSPLSEKEPLPTGLPDVGRIVSMHFFWGSHILQDVHRGPFTSSSDWIISRLSLSEKDCQSTLDNCHLAILRAMMKMMQMMR